VDTCKYYDTYFDPRTLTYEPFYCNNEPYEESDNCIFHEVAYLKENNDVRKVQKRLLEKIEESEKGHMDLLCVGYYLPELSFKDQKFNMPVFFYDCKFLNNISFNGSNFSCMTSFRESTFRDSVCFDRVNFSEVSFSETCFHKQASFYDANFSSETSFRASIFCGRVEFIKAKFQDEVKFILFSFMNKADFTRAYFADRAIFTDDPKFDPYIKSPKIAYKSFASETLFNHVLFDKPQKIIFDVSDLSKVSFLNSDITRIRFSDKTRWAEPSNKEEYLKIIEEKWIEEKVKQESSGDISEAEKDISLEGVLSVYRNLRENYEFRLRYDDAGKFFIREMELKRRYREILSNEGNSVVVKSNPIRKNLSLTGVYYHLSRYGEDLLRPALIGLVVVFLSTLFWSIQANPIHEPSFSHVVGLTQAGNGTHWLKAFERSFADFLPLLSLGSDIKVGIVDYFIKIVGGVLTFGLLAIALRRKFERKYTR
jgi:uncharacterized protein YjbI with pentapeptide repeats